MTVKIGPVGTITCELGDTINETMAAWFSNTGNFTSVKSGGPPPGVTFSLTDDTVKGTPTATGTFPVTFGQQYGDKVGKIIVSEVLTPATPGTPSADLAGQTYTIPDNPGAVWKADGVVVEPGVHPSGQTSYTDTVKVTLTVAPAAGYKFEGGTPGPVTYTFPVLPWEPPTHLYATAGEPVTITAGEVGAAGGCTPENVKNMRFVEEQADVVPGLTPDDSSGSSLGGWTKIAGTPTQAGEYTLAVELMQGGNSYGTYVAPLTVAGSSTPPVDPDPEEPGDPGTTPDGHHVLSARVAAYVGRPGDPEALALADAQLPIVEAFVHGYTRGRGFKDGRPVAPLQAVVVTAAARLVTNPEQVYQYTTADYSERPAVLNGWTIPERGILHNYRKRAGSCG